MATTGQNPNAAQYLADLTSLASQLHSMLKLAQDLQDRQTAHNYAAQLQATATYAVNADGSAGAADTDPVVGHPMAGLGVSFYNVDVFRSHGVDDFVAFLTGFSPTVMDRRPVLGQLIP